MHGSNFSKSLSDAAVGSGALMTEENVISRRTSLINPASLGLTDDSEHVFFYSEQILDMVIRSLTGRR